MTMGKRTQTDDDYDPYPRDRCPRCCGIVETVSEDPLEEFGIGPACDYRAAEINGEIVETYD